MAQVLGLGRIGDFRSQRYHWVCQVPRVRCRLNRLTGRLIAPTFIGGSCTSSLRIILSSEKQVRYQRFTIV